MARGTLDKIAGVLRKGDLLHPHVDGKPLHGGIDDGSGSLLAAMREPLVAHDGATVPQVLDTFKDRPVQVALIVDECGALRSVVTQTDLVEALAGEITDADDGLDVTRREDGSFLVEATMAVQDAASQPGIADVPHDGGEYRTLAGFVLWRFGRIPTTGEHRGWATAD